MSSEDTSPYAPSNPFLLHRQLQTHGSKALRQTLRNPRALTLELNSLECKVERALILRSASGQLTTPMSMVFSNSLLRRPLLAVADEGGCVSILAAERSESGDRHNTSFVAHSSAIFDVIFSENDKSIVTASGDYTSKIWDTETQRCTYSFRGATGSMKVIRRKKNEECIFASGSRDGRTYIWDTRSSKIVDKFSGEEYTRPFGIIRGSHLTYSTALKPSPKRRKVDSPLRPSTKPTAYDEGVGSVTSLCFSPNGYSLITTGSTDGCLKVWDLRKTYTTAVDSRPVPMEVVDMFLTRKWGISSVDIDASGTMVLVTALDGRNYIYDFNNLSDQSRKIYHGCMVESFYVKSSFSADGRFILSGSSDGSARIWRVDSPGDPCIELLAHKKEVSSVAWSPSDSSRIATCSDDSDVRIWRLDTKSSLSRMKDMSRLFNDPGDSQSESSSSSWM